MQLQPRQRLRSMACPLLPLIPLRQWLLRSGAGGPEAEDPGAEGPEVVNRLQQQDPGVAARRALAIPSQLQLQDPGVAARREVAIRLAIRLAIEGEVWATERAIDVGARD